MCEREYIKSDLNIEMWEHYLPETQYKELLDGIKFGFTLGYIGPVSYHAYNKNHSSAEKFPDHINDYIKKELEQGTLMGPFNSVPFEFSHSSPLMTRDKSTSESKRVITDLTFPPEASINAYIPKNTILGRTRPHHLPKSDDVIEQIDFEYRQYYLYTLDIANAYKNFPIDPMEWPLLTLIWNGQYYIENRLPFGARNSSVTMQSLALAILHILKKHDIQGWMYLDDLLVMSKGPEKAKRDVEIITKIFTELGLPTVPHKAQGPKQVVEWIGIIFDMEQFTLSVPEKKLQQVITNIQNLYHRETVTETEMQSVVGKIVHISKCIVPSRIFTSRILSAMRSNEEGIIKITNQVRKDFDWFINFAIAWNGTANMNSRKHIRTIYTWYEKPFIMAIDTQTFYICNTQKINGKISETQATVLNIAMAIDIFSKETDCLGQTIVKSNIDKAVRAYNVGNTRDHALDHIVRANWFTYGLANKDYRIELGDLPQTLSDLLKCVKCENPQYEVNKFADENKLQQIFPQITMFDNYVQKLLYRPRDD